MATTTLEILPAGDPRQHEAVAVAGFLAGYRGQTRLSYATDLRLFADWCREAKLDLFGVRRAHLEPRRAGWPLPWPVASPP